MQRPPRVLVLTPWVPYPVTGACQQDRFNGLLQMRKLGYELRVIAKVHAFQPREQLERAFAEGGIPLALLPYVRHPFLLLLRRLLRIFRTPALLDGAALEYTDPAYEALVRKTVEEFRPDVVWIEYTCLWPVLRLLKPYGIPMIMKSSLNEPMNCRAENGYSVVSYLKSLPKFPGERIAAQESDLILAITPEEEEWYRGLGAGRSGVLPLRGLSQCFARKIHQDKPVLDVVFLSSNYNMGHNRDALLYLLNEVLPIVRQRARGQFRFHLTGKKFPDAYRGLLKDDVRLTGFVEDLGAFLATMDIALSPWVSGHGMQQKVFEPLCRGLPLLTHKVAGYPFEDGKEVLLAQTPGEFVERLMMLRDPSVRQRISDAGLAKAQTLFSEAAVMKVVDDAIRSVLRR